MSLIRLLDISGLFWPIWRFSEAKGRPIGDAAAETVQALREHAARAGADYIVACCDSPGRTFRHDIAEEYKALVPEFRGYKAHRPEKDPAMMAALDRVIDEIEQDGVPVFRVAGFEADDVIATLTAWAVDNGHDVEVFSEDKDLLSLVRDPDPENDAAPSVVIVRRDGTRQTSAECIARMGVPPELVPHLLALAGDTSDGVRGVPGVGAKTAAALLWGEAVDGEWRPTPFKRFDDIVAAAVDEQAAWEASACYRAHQGAKKGATHEVIAKRLGVSVEDVAAFLARPEPPKPDEYKARFAKDVRQSLIRHAASFEIGLRLTRLRADVPLDFAAVTAPRVPKPKDDAANGYQIDGYDDTEENDMPSNDIMAPEAQPTQSTTEPAMPPSSAQAISAEIVPPASRASAPERTQAPVSVHVAPPPRAELAVREIQQVTETALAAPRGAYSLSLDPRDFREARMLAKDVADARIFKKIESPQQALALIMTGREYGLPAMAALRLIHIIEGMPAVHAQVKIGLAMKSPRVEYMYIREWVDDGEKSYCVWVGKRRNRPEPDTCRYGVADAQRQGLVKPSSNWVKIPGWMSMVRSGANMATMLIPDEMAGLYTFDEMGAAEPMGDVEAAKAAYHQHVQEAARAHGVVAA